VIISLVARVVNAQLFLLQMDLCGLYCRTDLADSSSIIQRRDCSRSRTRGRRTSLFICLLLLQVAVLSMAAARIKFYRQWPSPHFKLTPTTVNRRLSTQH